MISVSDRVENIVGKGENAGYQQRKCWLPAFSPFPTMFFKRLLSKGLCGYTISITCPTKAKILNPLSN